MARILVVENDADLAESWSRALVDAGHEVSVCADVHSALDLAEESPPAVAITEILLPGLGGVAFTGRAKLRDPGLKVIAVTGDPAALGAQVGALALARRVGADLLLEKPIAEGTLVASVNQLLGDERG